MITSDYTSFKYLSLAKEIFIRETERKKILVCVCFGFSSKINAIIEANRKITGYMLL